MKILLILLSMFLVSCGTNSTEEQKHLGGVPNPEYVNIKIKMVSGDSTTDQILVSWDVEIFSAPSASTEVSYFEVLKSESLDISRADISTYNKVITSATFENLSDNKSYYFWIRACGDESKCFDFSKVFGIKTKEILPEPAFVNIKMISGVSTTNQVSVVWKIKSSSTDVKYFEVHKSEDQDMSGADISTYNKVITSATFENLSPNTTYYFWIRGCSESVCFDFSEVFGIKTKELPPEPVDQKISVNDDGHKLKYGGKSHSFSIVEDSVGTGAISCSSSSSLLFSVSFNPVNRSCDVITSSDTKNYLFNDTKTSIVVVKKASALFNTATTSFEVVVQPTLLQLFRGGFYHDEDVDAGIHSAYSTVTQRIEKVDASCTNTENSKLLLHYTMTSFTDNKGDVYDFLYRCSKGVIHLEIKQSGSVTILDGQIDGTIHKNNPGIEVLEFSGFAKIPDDPSQGFSGSSVRTLFDIALGTTQKVKVELNTFIIERKIYNDGKNSAGTYQFKAGDYHVINDTNINVSDKVSNCQEFIFVSVKTGKITDSTIVCKFLGPVSLFQL
jgi:hypothetical protein